MTRSERLNLRVEPEALHMLQEMCEVTGLDMSNLVRLLIRREHARMVRDGEVAAERKPRRTKR